MSKWSKCHRIRAVASVAAEGLQINGDLPGSSQRGPAG